MKQILTICFFALLLPAAQAQQLSHFDAPYLRGGDTLQWGFIGGLNTPQYSEIDFDGDGIKDLLVYDRSGQVALPFRNGGAPGEVDYSYMPQWKSLLPQRIENFMLARDYNGDGIADIFYYNRNDVGEIGVGVLKGQRNAQGMWSYTEEVELLRHSDYRLTFDSYIQIGNPDLPAIADMDGDGDMDIIAYNATDPTYLSNVWFYRNLSAEQGYGSDSLIFELGHACWGMFGETFYDNNTVFLSPGIDSCANNPWWERSGRHGGGTLSAIDYNGDGAMDLVMGDVEVPTLNLLTSSLVNDTALVIAQDSTFPSYDVSVDIFSFPAAYFLDVNNDGLTDMLAATNETSIFETRSDSTTWFYENTQSNSNMNFTLRNRHFFGEHILDVGARSQPSLVDIDGDGLLDMVISQGANYRSLNDMNMGFTFLRNVGTSTAPAFEFVSDNWAGLDSLNLVGPHLSFGDLDGDGDQDMLIGLADGSLCYIENIGTATNVQWAAPQYNYITTQIFDYSKPQLVDMDGDGDLDLMVGSAFNNIHYYENQGTPASPNFVFVSNTFGFDLMSEGSAYAAPYFIERNGEMELFLGHERGGVIHLGNIDGNITGIYDTLSLELSGIFTGRYSALALADLNGDDTLELVVGNERGGIDIYSFMAAAVDSTPVALAPLPSQELMQLFPNPSATGMLSLRRNKHLSEAAELRVYNQLGQLVATHILASGKDLEQIELSEQPAGLYYIQLRVGKEEQSILWQRL